MRKIYKPDLYRSQSIVFKFTWQAFGLQQWGALDRSCRLVFEEQTRNWRAIKLLLVPWGIPSLGNRMDIWRLVWKWAIWLYRGGGVELFGIRAALWCKFGEEVTRQFELIGKYHTSHIIIITSQLLNIFFLYTFSWMHPQPINPIIMVRVTIIPLLYRLWDVYLLRVTLNWILLVEHGVHWILYLFNSCASVMRHSTRGASGGCV